MRRHTEVNATIAHPVDRVFAYLVDPLRWHEFAPACVYRRQIGDQPPRIGTRWMATDRIGPFRFHFIDELAELEPNRRVVWLSSAPWNSRVEYICAPVGADTSVRASYDGDISGSLRLLTGWLPPAVVRRILAQDFRRLDKLFEREAQAASRWQQGYLAGVAGADGVVSAAADRADDVPSR
jgi:uncharacterized protein YndB with AHSA1/START domain